MKSNMDEIERVRELGKIVNETKIIKDPIMEYAGYGDETSARVAGYNYTQVGEKNKEVFVYSTIERQNANNMLEEIIRNTKNRKVKKECKKHIRYISTPQEERELIRKSLKIQLAGLTALGIIMGYDYFNGKKG